jgi:hypothetical protein
MNIVFLVLKDGTKLITQVEEEPEAEVGKPDCRLIDPYLIDSDRTLMSWYGDYTFDNVYKIHSDFILTMATPRREYIKNYLAIMSVVYGENQPLVEDK